MVTHLLVRGCGDSIKNRILILSHSDFSIPIFQNRIRVLCHIWKIIATITVFTVTDSVKYSGTVQGIPIDMNIRWLDAYSFSRQANDPFNPEFFTYRRHTGKNKDMRRIS